MTITHSAPIRGPPTTPGPVKSPVPPTTHRTVDGLRIALDLIFRWPFLDKLFVLGYSTPSAKAWIPGGSPTKGFLGHVAVGPFQSFFCSIAGCYLG